MIEIIYKYPKIFSIFVTIVVFIVILWYKRRPKNDDAKKDKKKDEDKVEYSQYLYPGIISICVGIVVYLFITANNKNVMTGGGGDSEYETDTSVSVRRYLSSIRDYGKEINSDHNDDHIDVNVPNEPIIVERHVNNTANNVSKTKILSSGIKIPMNIDDNILSI